MLLPRGSPRLAGHEPEHHGQDDDSTSAHQRRRRTSGRPRSASCGAGGWPGPGGVPEDEVARAPAGSKGTRRSDGHREGDEQPPGEAAAKPPVEGAGDQEARTVPPGSLSRLEARPATGRRRGCGDQRCASPVRPSEVRRWHPGLASAAGSNSVSAASARPGAVGVARRLDPHHPRPRWRCARWRSTGRSCSTPVRATAAIGLGVGVVAGLVGAGLADDPALVARRRTAPGPAPAPDGRPATAGPADTGVGLPVRSKRLPAMTRMPGPSQVSRARASPGDGRRRGGVASGVEHQVADHHDPAAHRQVTSGRSSPVRTRSRPQLGAYGGGGARRHGLSHRRARPARQARTRPHGRRTLDRARPLIRRWSRLGRRSRHQP